MLLLLAFSLFRPDFWRDQVFPAFEFRPAVQLQADLSVRAEGESLRIRIESENERGEFAERTVLLAMPPDSGDRLSAMGFSTVPDGDALKVTDVGFSSPAEQAGLEAAFTRRIVGFETPLDQPAQTWFVIPPLLLLGCLVCWQRRRA